MMFASKTPRDLSSDPRPRSTIGTGRRVAQGSEYAGESVWNPRPEFDHPQHNEPNPILAYVRKYNTADRNAFAWDLAEFQRLGGFDFDVPDADCAAISSAAPEQIDHARRVLERLARLAEALPLDPKPWYVAEADEGQRPDAGRYTHAEYLEDSVVSEWGGNIYNLAAWKPREGYEQNKEKYA